VEQYAIRGGRPGYDRLKLLAQDRWPATAALLERLGIEPGMRCIDVGCGGGEVSFEIARLVGSDGHVTGIDMDEVKLALGRAAAADRGIANVELRAADVNHWSEEAGYDLVYCRFLLQHLSRPIDLLARMWSAVRPGGVIAVEDTDFDGLFCDPPNEGFDFYWRTIRLLVRKRGGDSTLGRKLHRYFLKAGIQDPSWRMVQDVAYEGVGKVLALSTLEAIADAALAERLATVNEMREAVTSLAAFIEDPTTMVASPRIFQVWRRRDPA
jgi:ubiquinone/menaquinone biosynthesis C-methylase UbiE